MAQLINSFQVSAAVVSPLACVAASAFMQLFLLSMLGPKSI